MQLGHILIAISLLGQAYLFGFTELGK